MATGLLAREAGGGGAMANTQEQPGDAPNVSPEEQAQYTAFVETALNLISDDRFEDGLLKSLGGSKDPVLSLASTALTVVQRVEASASQKGQQVSGDVLLHAGEEIVGALAEMAGAANIHDYTQEEMDGAFYRAADMYREEKQARGEIDQDAAAADLQDLAAADKAGQLPPQFAQAAQAMQGGAR